MKYYYNLYQHEQHPTNKDKYLIILSQNERNHLEILHSVLFEQKAMQDKEVFVVGVAKGYLEALELVEKITQEVYDKTNGVDIRGFILKNQQEYEKGNV